MILQYIRSPLKNRRDPNGQLRQRFVCKYLALAHLHLPSTRRIAEHPTRIRRICPHRRIVPVHDRDEDERAVLGALPFPQGDEFRAEMAVADRGALIAVQSAALFPVEKA